MCGFIGWFQARGHVEAERRRQLTGVLRLIAHRGPDDAMEAAGGDWWMGVRRLSVLDLTTAGRQPMRFANGRFTLAFNGEIYNHHELRAAAADRDFCSTGDTEALGALLER